MRHDIQNDWEQCSDEPSPTCQCVKGSCNLARFLSRVGEVVSLGINSGRKLGYD